MPPAGATAPVLAFALAVDLAFAVAFVFAGVCGAPGDAPGCTSSVACGSLGSPSSSGAAGSIGVVVAGAGAGCVDGRLAESGRTAVGGAVDCFVAGSGTPTVSADAGRRGRETRESRGQQTGREEAGRRPHASLASCCRAATRT